MVCPGPVFSNLVERAFTGVAGQDFGQKHREDMKRMKTTRCARLMAIAIANNVNEAWICFQPILSLYYIAQYLPCVSKWVFPKMMSPERASKYREGGEIMHVWDVVRIRPYFIHHLHKEPVYLYYMLKPSFLLYKKHAFESLCHHCHESNRRLFAFTTNTSPD